MPNQQDKLDEIIQQQEIVADSVKRYKTQLESLNKETTRITESNASLQSIADSLKEKIDLLNADFENKNNEIKNFNKDYQLKSEELKEINSLVKQKNLELSKMEEQATEKIRQEITALQSSADEQSTRKQNLLIDIALLESKINKLNEIVGTLNDSITILKSQEKDQKNVVDNETVNINELTKNVDKLKNQIESYTDVLDVIKQDIKDGQAEITELENTKKELENLLVDFNKKVESANAEFDELSTKSRILIERGEYQEGQAIFLKEQFEKIGRDYQPYQP
jgi:chromosome segregation protein